MSALVKFTESSVMYARNIELHKRYVMQIENTIFILGRGERRDFDRRRQSPPRERDMRRRDPRDYRETEFRDRGRDRFEGRMAQDSSEFRYLDSVYCR